MLSISPISSSQRNKQNSPNFKGHFSVSGDLVKEAYKEYAVFQTKFNRFVVKHQSRLFENQQGSDFFVVTCDKSLNKTVFNELDNLAEKFKLKLHATNEDIYKQDPDFDLDKAINKFI